MSDTPKHIMEEASFRASAPPSTPAPKDGPFLRMAVEGMALHPDQDGSGYQCNRNMLLQDVYDTCEQILLKAVDVDLALDLALHGRKYVVRRLAAEEDVPFDLLWAVWVRMNEKAGKLNV